MLASYIPLDTSFEKKIKIMSVRKMMGERREATHHIRRATINNCSRLSIVLVKLHGNPMHINSKKSHGNQSGEQQPVVIVIAEK
jgi:hypothetical protein